MKKNEMIERLRCFLSEEQGYKEDWSYAEGIVNFLVSQGMQPPSIVVVKKFRQWDKRVKMHLSREVGEIENKWEPEDEEK
jgi:hypothetical protein